MTRKSIRQDPPLTTPYVFLGGSCNPTTWRADTAIPFLEAAGLSYYNPQRTGWTQEMADEERVAKEAARILLFVIDNETRAIASILEATEAVCTGRSVVLVVRDFLDDKYIDGQLVTGAQLKDLNRARAYLRELARNHRVDVFDNVLDALNEIPARI